MDGHIPNLPTCPIHSSEAIHDERSHPWQRGPEYRILQQPKADKRVLRFEDGVKLGRYRRAQGPGRNERVPLSHAQG